MKLKIGTRGSELALIQANLVADALKIKSADLEIETVIITTKGDRNLAPIPLDTVGKSWFTAEIDRALKNGAIDLAVHSLKDLPLELDPQLSLATILSRADPSDVLVSHLGKLADLPAGSVVGTDSSRRRAQILYLRPDLTVRSLRGNVQTRLRKLDEHQYDAIALAAAGLVRLGEVARLTERLDPTTFIPAAGQGALGVTFRAFDLKLSHLLGQLEDPETVICVGAERAFTAAIGGGCQLPIGCYATISSSIITIHAMLADGNDTRIYFKKIHGPAAASATLAQNLALDMLKHCPFNFSVSHGH